MTVNRGVGVSKVGAVGTTTLEHRLMLAGLYAENAPGVPRSGVLAQAADLLVVGKTTMSYDIGPAPFVIGRTAQEGVYTPTTTGTTNVTTDAAPGSGSRWDLVWVKQNDTAKGDADNAAVMGVEKGLASATPSKPYGTVPAGAYVLAEAQIFNSTTGTSGGSNTITQVWRHTAARGSRIVIRSADERAEITSPAKGMEILRTDLTQAGASGVVERWNGATWDHFGIAGWTTASNGLAAGAVWNLGAHTAVPSKTTDATFVTVGSGGITFRDAGNYDVVITQKYSANVSNGRAFISLDATSGLGATAHARVPFGINEDTTTLSVNITVAAGQTVYPQLFQSVGTVNVTGSVNIARRP